MKVYGIYSMQPKEILQGGTYHVSKSQQLFAKFLTTTTSYQVFGVISNMSHHENPLCLLPTVHDPHGSPLLDEAWLYQHFRRTNFERKSHIISLSLLPKASFIMEHVFKHPLLHPNYFFFYWNRTFRSKFFFNEVKNFWAFNSNKDWLHLKDHNCSWWCQLLCTQVGLRKQKRQG